MFRYIPRNIQPPRTNPWLEAGRQASGLGSLILGIDQQKRERERQAMLDERDESRYQGTIDWRERMADVEQERFDLGQRDLGRVRVEPGDDQMSAISEAIAGARDATSVPGVVPSDSGVGALIRQTNPAFDVGESSYRYDPREDRQRQGEMRRQEFSREASDRAHEQALERQQAPRWMPPQQGAAGRWSLVPDYATGRMVRINLDTGEKAPTDIGIPAGGPDLDLDAALDLVGDRYDPMVNPGAGEMPPPGELVAEARALMEGRTYYEDLGMLPPVGAIPPAGATSAGTGTVPPPPPRRPGATPDSRPVSPDAALADPSGVSEIQALRSELAGVSPQKQIEYLRQAGATEEQIAEILGIESTDMFMDIIGQR